MAATLPRWPALAVVAALAGALGCGARNDADPVLIPGGGVSSGEIARFLNVHVIDAETGDPLPGAFVLVESDVEELSLTGTTDSTGLARFEDRHLRGPQVVTAAAPGFANTTWFGVDGANVTLPLADEDKAVPNVETADVRGTIDGFDTLPAPIMGHYWLAIINYSLTEELGDPANSIVQPSIAGVPENICLSGLPCSWHMTARTGTQAHYYLLLDGDSNGTLDPADDTQIFVGWGVLPGLDLANGAVVMGETLPMPVMDVSSVNVTVGSPPAGLDQAVLIGVVDLGELEGMLPFAFVDVSAASAVLIDYPGLSGELSGRSYRFVLVSQTSTMPDEPPSAIVIGDGIADLSSDVELASYLEPPSGLGLSNDTFEFGASAGATMYAAGIRDSANLLVWTVAILDRPAAGAFTLPVLPDGANGAELPFGALDYSVSALDVAGFDPADFSLDGLIDGAARLSSNDATVTR